MKLIYVMVAVSLYRSSTLEQRPARYRVLNIEYPFLVSEKSYTLQIAVGRPLSCGAGGVSGQMYACHLSSALYL